MQSYIQKNLIRSTLLIFTVNTVAVFLYWYRLFWWFDMPMHFLGGFFVLFLVVYVYLRFNPGLEGKILNKNFLYWAVFYTFLIGFGWEVFEWVTDFYTGAKAFHLLDTYSDLFFDMAGAFTAVLLIKFRGAKHPDEC